MGPATAEKSKAQLFEEKAKLKELRRYTRELLKERDELHASLEAGSAASSSEADEARAAREAQLREAHDALQREHDAVVERLREAELAAARDRIIGNIRTISCALRSPKKDMTSRAAINVRGDQSASHCARSHSPFAVTPSRGGK